MTDMAREYVGSYGFDGEPELTGEEIVRCRDCVHFRIEPWDEVLAAQYGAPPMICERTGDMDDVKPNGYCAWAERKEGGDD